jgi:hypothetical protein
MIELPEHPWFVGCQFHPEFKSKPMAPHPLFTSFVEASLHQSLGKRKTLGNGRPVGKLTTKENAISATGRKQKPQKKVSATGKKAREFFGV